MPRWAAEKSSKSYRSLLYFHSAIAVIDIGSPQASERLRIVAKHYPFHGKRGGGLPCIILAHAMRGATLQDGNPLRLLVVQALPTIAL